MTSKLFLFFYAGFTKEKHTSTFDDLKPFISAFLEEKQVLKGQDPDSVTAEDIAKFTEQVRLCWAVRYIYVCICMILKDLTTVNCEQCHKWQITSMLFQGQSTCT